MHELGLIWPSPNHKRSISGTCCGDGNHELFHVASVFQMFDLVRQSPVSKVRQQAVQMQRIWSFASPRETVEPGPAEAAEAAEAKGDAEKLGDPMQSDILTNPTNPMNPRFRSQSGFEDGLRMVEVLGGGSWHILASRHSIDNVPTVEETVILFFPEACR